MDFHYAIRNMFPQESEIFQSRVLKPFREGINRIEGPRQTRYYKPFIWNDFRLQN